VRLGEVLETISRDATDRAWSMRYEVDDGLWWDHERQVWVAGDGFAYEPPALVEGRGAGS
jgi:hypothetical protein